MGKLKDTQLPPRLIDIIQGELTTYRAGHSVSTIKAIPPTSEIPTEKNIWLKIPAVICVFVDMQGSTKLSASASDGTMAAAYQLFTGTLVRLFHSLQAPYIDVKGDGVFALFDGDKPHTALAAVVSCRTFVQQVFTPELKKRCGVVVGCRAGIDRRKVLVKKIGLKRYGDRTDRQNEVWAGRPVNMAAKLTSLAEANELLVSDRFFNKLKDERALSSCGCPDGEKEHLWTGVDLAADDRFDFDKAFRLKSAWCTTHGQEFCDGLLNLERDE